SSWAAALTGLGIRAPPRPRRLSARVTTSRTSCPSATRARRGGTATAGVPRNASFIGLRPLIVPPSAAPSPARHRRARSASKRSSAFGRSVRFCPVAREAQGPLAQCAHRFFALVGLQPFEEEHP